MIGLLVLSACAALTTVYGRRVLLTPLLGNYFNEPNLVARCCVNPLCPNLPAAWRLALGCDCGETASVELKKKGDKPPENPCRKGSLEHARNNMC